MLGFLGNIGRKIGQGAQQVGQGLRRLGEMDDDPMMPTSRVPMVQTPPFAMEGAETMDIRYPNHPRFRPNIDGPAEPVPLAKNADWHPPLSAPDPAPAPNGWRPPLALPEPPTAGPKPMRLREAVTLAPMTGDDPLALAGARTTMPQPVDDTLNDYRGNRINNMAGFQRDQYVREGGHTGEDGKFHAKRSWKTGLQNALLGFAQGMASGGGLGAGAGGALGGLLGATFNPTVGRERVFDVGYAPHIQRGEQERQQQEALQRQTQMQEAQRRRWEAQAAMDEAKAKGYPQELEIDRMLREKQMKAADAELERARRAPVPRPRNTITDADGYLRDRDTMELMRDPVTGQPVKAYQRPVNEREVLPFASSGLGIYDRRTGQVTERAPEKVQDIPGAAQTALRQAMKAKSDAEAFWATAKQYPQDSPEYKEAVRDAQEAQEAYNSLAASLGQMYGDYYETGPGQGGWSYIKPRQNAQTSRPAATSGGGGKAGPTMKLGDAKEILKRASQKQ